MKKIDKIQDFDIDDVINNLWQGQRKIFHGEADFQFELVEVIKKYYNKGIIRVEHPLLNKETRKYIDILIIDENHEIGIAIELKYKTKFEKFYVQGEKYILKDHKAKNDNSYFILKDVEEIESIVGNPIEEYDIKILKGYVIFVTNNESYMKYQIKGKAEKFSLNAKESNKTAVFNGKMKYENLRGKDKYAGLNLKKEHVGEWTELKPFKDDGEKEHVLYELVFKIPEK